MATIRLGIDMGTTTTTIYREGKGLVLQEPTRALCEMGDNGHIKIREFGKRADKMQGRIPSHMRLIDPIADGEVRNLEVATKLLREYINRVTVDNPEAKIYALFSVPCGLTAENKRQYQVVAYGAGVSELELIPTAIASALGAGCDLRTQQNVFVVDIGGGCTDIAVLGEGTIIHGLTLNVGSQKMNNSIERYIQQKFDVHIDPRVANILKEEIGSLMPNDVSSMVLKGVANDNSVQQIVVTADDIFKAIAEYYELITESINTILNACSPEIVSYINRVGIVVCGNAGKIIGLDRFMYNYLKINIAIAEGGTSAQGLGMLLGDKALLKSILEQI